MFAPDTDLSANMHHAFNTMVFKRGYVSSMSRKFSTRPRIKLTLTPKPFTVQTRDSEVYEEVHVFVEKKLDAQVSIAQVPVNQVPVAQVSSAHISDAQKQNPSISNTKITDKHILESPIPQVHGSITQESTIQDTQTDSQVRLAQVIQIKPLISPRPRFLQKPAISPKPNVVKTFTDKI